MATITLFVHSPSTRVSSERRLPLSDDLYAIRGRLERITGIPSEHQCIQLWTARTDEEDANIASGQRLVWDSSYKMSPLPSSLLAVGAQDGMGLKVLDERPADVASRLVLSEDNSSVQSFAMTDEEYQRRQGEPGPRPGRVPLLAQTLSLLLLLPVHQTPSWPSSSETSSAASTRKLRLRRSHGRSSNSSPVTQASFPYLWHHAVSFSTRHHRLGEVPFDTSANQTLPHRVKLGSA